jgi:hypothetical protein
MPISFIEGPRIIVIWHWRFGPIKARASLNPTILYIVLDAVIG